MWDDETNVRIFQRESGQDQPRHGDGVLEARTDHPGEREILAVWSATDADWMEERDAGAAVELGEKRIKGRIVERLTEHGGAEADADDAWQIEAAIQLFQRRVEVGQRDADERVEAVGVARVQIDVEVVTALGDVCRDALVRVVRRRVAQRQDHALDAGIIHELELGIDWDVQAHARHRLQATRALDTGDPQQKLVQRTRVIMSVHINAHARQDIGFQGGLTERYASCSRGSVRRGLLLGLQPWVRE